MKKFLSDVLIECGLQVSGTTALGTATATTVATSDNSTNIATTAFVKAQGYITGYTNNYITGLSFNTTNGVLTVTRQGLTDLTVDLDGRYLQSESDTLDTVTARGSVTTNSIGVSTVNIIGSTAGAELLTVDGTYGRLFTVTDDLSDSLFSVNTVAGLPALEIFADNTIKLGSFANPIEIDSSSNIVIPGTITASGYNDSNWNTAYNDRIASVAVSGTTNKTLTLTQGDGGTVTTTWTDNFDNYGSWNLKTNSVQRTTVQSGGDFDLIAGTDISISYAAGGKVTIASTATGSIDYISNVALNESSLDFTGVGAAFTGSIDLSGLNPTVRTVYETVKNVSGAPIQKGTPLAVRAGQTSGNLSDVVPADASDPARMPAIFIANADIADEAEGEAVLFGNLTGVNTELYESGTTVYVAPGGGWTADKPIWPNLIQNLGVITKQHHSNGAGIVTGVGRSNALPNLTAGKIWVGSAAYPIESTTVHVDEANARVGIGTTSPAYPLDIVGFANSSSGFRVTDGTIDNRVSWVSGNVGFFGTISNHPIAFNTNASERMRITSDGNVAINSTTTSGYRLYVNGSTWINGGTNFQDGVSIFRTESGAAEVMRIASNGNVGINTTVPDRRLHVKDSAIVITKLEGTNQGSLLDLVNSNASQTYNGLRFTQGTTGKMAITHIADGTTKGYVQIGNSWAAGSEILVVDGRTSNVGIGTTSPSNKLTVEDTIGIKRAGVAAISTIQQTGTGLIVNAPSGYHPLVIQHNGSEFFRFTNSGNLGIGTTSPDSGLTISRSNQYASLNIYKADTTNQIVYLGTGSSGGDDDAVLQLFDEATEKVRIFTAGSSWFNGGDVGIGTTNPIYKLDVASGNSSNAFGLSLSGTERLKMYADGSSNYFEAKSGQNFRFTTTGGANFTILNNGNVGIGTTSPSEKLTVSGNLSLDGVTRKLYFDTTGAAKQIILGVENDYQFHIVNARGNSSRFILGNADISLGTSSVKLFYISTSTGNVGIGTTSPASNLHVVGNVQIEGGSTSVVLETNNKGADPAGALFGEYDIATTYGAIVDYVIYDAGRDNMRSGTFSAVWNAAETRYNDVSTVDIGDTLVVTLTSQINGANVELIVTGDAVYTIKFNTKLIK